MLILRNCKKKKKNSNQILMVVPWPWLSVFHQITLLLSLFIRSVDKFAKFITAILSRETIERKLSGFRLL